MSDERTEVLKMVADKKISVEEAERLLRALDESDRRREQSPGPSSRGFGLFGLGASFRGIGELVRTTVEEAISGFGLDIDLDHEALEEVAVRDGRFEVPAGALLAIRQGFHGNLELTASDGDACVVDGNITRVVRGPRGYVVKLGKPEGRFTRVQVPRTAGELKAGIGGGEIKATALPCPATLKTMGGELTLVKLRKKFEAHTMGGRILLELYPELDGDCAVETMGGRVESGVPGGLRARIKATTLGGKVKVDPGVGEVTSRSGWGEQGAVVELGSPGPGSRPEIRVNTLGGSIHVRKSGE
ncbi:MAG: SHOCT-like domain-containing protein [Myxococcaceae bacterium]